MIKKLLVFVLIILPTSLLLTGCETAASVVQQAKDLQTKATTQIEEVKTSVANVIAEVENAKEALIEKKRQLDEAVASIQAAMDSIDQLLNRGETGTDTDKSTGVSTSAAVELLVQKAELETSLTDIDAALTTVNETLAETPAETVPTTPTADTPTAEVTPDATVTK